MLLAGIEITPDFPDEGTKTYFESMQVRTYIFMNDWQSLKEYLELVAVGVRSKLPQSLDVPQLRYRVWWYNLEGLCALRLGEWDEACHYLKEVFRIAQHRPQDTTGVAFSALRLMMILYNSCPQEHVFQPNTFTELDSFWKIIVPACLLGYQADQKINACNGVLLVILLQATGRENAGHQASLSEGVANTILYLAASRKSLGMREKFIQSVSSTLRCPDTSVSSRFLHTLRSVLASTTTQSEQAKRAMEEAENHLF